MTPGAVPGVLTPQWPAPAQVRAASTERRGGASAGPYASANLGARVGDDPAAVAANRRALSEALGLTSEPRWLEQVHGASVVDLDTHRALSAAPPRADGAVTSRPGQACVVMTADCLPVLLCDAEGARVGVAHAGWRGLAGGVLPAAVACMGVNSGGLLAWLGPAIGQHAYEVGEEVRQALLASDPGAGACFEPNAAGRWQADLYGLARRALTRCGVQRVYGGGLCTYTQSERFFSHRREAPCGRMATLIWLEA